MSRHFFQRGLSTEIFAIYVNFRPRQQISVTRIWATFPDQKFRKHFEHDFLLSQKFFAKIHSYIFELLFKKLLPNWTRGNRAKPPPPSHALRCHADIAHRRFLGGRLFGLVWDFFVHILLVSFHSLRPSAGGFYRGTYLLLNLAHFSSPLVVSGPTLLLLGALPFLTLKVSQLRKWNRKKDRHSGWPSGCTPLGF